MEATRAKTRLSRRGALASAAGLVIGLSLPTAGVRAQSGAAQAFRPSPQGGGALVPNAFVRIGTDDTVTVLVKHIEFGQGPWTGLCTLVAEELDADWSQLRAEHAPSDVELYKNMAFGIQGTGGSTAIANSYEQMRTAGAAARAMLVGAAAEQWRVPASSITVEAGVVRHAASQRSARFGELAEAAARQPVPASPALKDPKDFRLIGREGQARKPDTIPKTLGRAQFTMDIQEPGMLTVLVAHPKRFGAKVGSFDAAAARAIKGVVDVRQVPQGVAVYAEGFWPARKGREALKITWDEAAAETRGSEAIAAEFRALARTKGMVVGQHGNDPAESFARADRVIEAEYVFPFLAHAAMEPLDGFLRWDGQQAQARFGSQLQTGDHAAIAQVLGIAPDKVSVETMLAGGSFGRRAQPSMHVAVELAEVAKAIGPNRPVKLVWTREDDMHSGYYRPMFVHRMRGAVKGGRITGWHDTVVGQPILRGTPFEAMITKGFDPTAVEGANEIPYAVPNFRCELHEAKTGVPVLWWRSVGHTHTGYAVETFIDALLEATRQDPVAGRLAMMHESPRAAGVLRRVAELAKWDGPGPREGRARGVAVVESFGSYVAQIAEVSIGPNLATDGPRVHKVWCAVDCGVAVNPEIIRAQMEGGIGFGLGHALFAEITLDQGRPVQSNFHDYRSLRIHEMPEIEVAIVRSSEKPTGVGEPGVPPIAPAVANAIARLGLPRPTRLPMVAEWGSRA